MSVVVAQTDAYVAVELSPEVVRVQSLLDPDVYEIIEQFERDIVRVIDAYGNDDVYERGFAREVAFKHVDLLTADAGLS